MIIISCNVDINKKRNEIFSEKSSFIKMKNSLTNQLFSEFLTVISAEISSTSDFLTMRITLTKSASVILCCFLHRAVKIVFKNIDSLISANFISQSVKMISDSDFQAVKVVSLTQKLHSWFWKNEITSII